MKLAILFILSLLVLSYSQGAEDTIVDGEQPQEQPSQEDIQRFYSMRRTACIVLSRHFINSRKDDVESTFNELPQEQQSQYANKLYSSGVEICEESIAPNQVQEVDILLFSSLSRTTNSIPLSISHFSSHSISLDSLKTLSSSLKAKNIFFNPLSNSMMIWLSEKNNNNQNN